MDKSSSSRVEVMIAKDPVWVELLVVCWPKSAVVEELYRSSRRGVEARGRAIVVIVAIVAAGAYCCACCARLPAVTLTIEELQWVGGVETACRTEQILWVVVVGDW